MFRLGVTNASTRCKGLCNNGVSRWLPKAKEDKTLDIRHLRKTHKIRVFPVESRPADFHSFLALFRRMMIRHFYAESHERRRPSYTQPVIRILTHSQRGMSRQKKTRRR